MEMSSQVIGECTAIRIKLQACSCEIVLSPDEAGDKVCVGKDRKVVKKLGTKTVIDPSHLNAVKVFSGRIDRYMRSVGAPFWDFWLVANERFDEVWSTLQNIRLEWRAAVDAFVTHYPKYVDEWALQKPEFASWIRAGAPSLEHVSNSFQFHLADIAIAPGQSSPEVFEQECTTIGDKIAHGIARDVKASRPNASTPLTAGIRGLLERSKQKCRDFAFVSPNLTVLADQIDATLHALPNGSKQLDGETYLKVQGILSIMSRPAAILNGEVLVVEAEAPKKVVSIPRASAEVDKVAEIFTANHPPAPMAATEVLKTPASPTATPATNPQAARAALLASLRK